MIPTGKDFSKNRSSQSQESLLNNQLNAAWPTRIIYCLALLGLILGNLNRGSWVGLAMGSGLVGWGVNIFSIIALGLIFRSYLVLRYKATLRARNPNILGLIVRGLGILVMSVGTLGMVSMFLVKPVTLLLFKHGRENGIGFFVVALYANILSSKGWIGCLIFEVSRLIGKRPTSKSSFKTSRERNQDLVVGAFIIVLAVGARFALQFVVKKPCYGPNNIQCVSTIDGGVMRPAIASVGSSVSLSTNIDEIVFLRKTEVGKAMMESPPYSLYKAGHPMEAPIASKIRLALNAAATNKGVAITLQVLDTQGETARFVTTIAKGAHLEPGNEGRQKVVINIPENVSAQLTYPSPDPVTHQSYVLDEIFFQMRQAIVSPREAAELSMRLSRVTREVSSAEIPAGKIDESLSAASCREFIEVVNVGDNETAIRPLAGMPLWRIIFLSDGSSDKYALRQINDRIGCNNDGVWAFNNPAWNGNFEIRRFSKQGELLNFISTTLPVDKLRGAWPDLESGEIIGNKMTFTAVSNSKPGLWTRRKLEIDL